MKVTADIIRNEFIGAHALVAQSFNPDCIGIGGLVVNETKQTFTLLCEGKNRSIIKETATFNFTFNDNTKVAIEGKLLVGRPEDRLKKSIKRLW
ncbi:MAG: ribonuclease P protein component 1 [Candidatus Bathyarchaeota archaeon]|nr:ribonuclease P protein component 1 [Candidatus Bathyarchaeota archaeon]MDD4324994.1 ribonuclease P protein component 1 [Candidatus Bathyarchaeota archaeon]MDI9577848.1 ribonuclease P protein component 1 [Thermoproteota archaeon]MDT8781203.1 ribonuclease P protein component 1 [Candidatus Bathyarchaeota archaeon]NLD66655.1 ribonuclease P protein component 1 [Thermoproteota archaeon]